MYSQRRTNNILQAPKNIVHLTNSKWNFSHKINTTQFNLHPSVASIEMYKIHSPHPPPPTVMGGCWAISRNIYIGGTNVKLGFWVGIASLGRGDFFLGGTWKLLV